MVSVDYGDIISRAWKTTIKHKWLWVYGIVLASLAGFGSSGGSGGGTSRGGSKTLPDFKDIPNNITPEAGKKLSQVLGASTNTVIEWLTHVSPQTWILLVVILTLLLIYVIVVHILIRSWATGALIGGLKDAENEKNSVNLINTTSYGKKSWKEVFLFHLFSFGLGLGLFIGCLSILLIGFLFFSIFPGTVIRSVWLIGMILVFILLGILSIPLFAMISIYGERLIVLQGRKAIEAFKKAFALSKSNILPTLLMGIIKGFLTTAIGCLSSIIFLIIVAIPAAIIAFFEFKDGMHFPSLTSIIIWVILFFLFIYATLLVRGILTVFSYSTWNLFFNEIIKQKKIT